MCFFCPISNAKQCGGSCGLCGDQCPGVETDSTLKTQNSTLLFNGMKEEDYQE